MALIITCLNCRHLLKVGKDGQLQPRSGATASPGIRIVEEIAPDPSAKVEGTPACPFCGSTSFSFVVDYWPDGRYGKRIRMPLPEEITDLAEAQAIEQESRLARKAQKKPEKAQIQGVTVNQLFPRYLEWCEMQLQPSTCRSITGAWRNNIKPKLGKERVDALNIHHITLYQRLRKKQVKNRTINKEMAYFSGFLGWCEEYAGIPRPDIRFNNLPARRPPPIILSLNEIISILRHLSFFYRCLCLCLYTIGLRSSEARNIKKSDLDYENAMVRITRKGGEMALKPISPWLLAMLKELIRQQEEEVNERSGKRRKRWRTELLPNTEGWVFYSPKTGKAVCQLRNPLIKAAEAAGITKRVYPHLFRHCFATHLMIKGVNLRFIQAALDHKQQSTTGFYTNVAQENLRDAIAPLIGDDDIARLQIGV